MAFLSLYHTGVHHSYTACLSAGASLDFQNSVDVIFSSILPCKNMGTSCPSFRNSATTSTYTLFMPTPHYKISIALGDAGILRIYPFSSNCLILENADDVDFTPINFPNSRIVGGYPCSLVYRKIH